MKPWHRTIVPRAAFVFCRSLLSCLGVHSLSARGGRRQARCVPPLAVLVVTLAITGSRFHSTLYPYTISRPSYFQHAILRDSTGNNLDYFFVPSSPGTYTTGVTIYATQGKKAPKEAPYLRSIGGRNVHTIGYVRIAGAPVPDIRGDFYGLAGRFTIERAGFEACKRAWHITVTFATDHPEERAALVDMVKSLRLTCKH